MKKSKIELDAGAVLAAIDYGDMAAICGSPMESFKRLGDKAGWSLVEHGKEFYLHRQRNSPILGVAHLDTVVPPGDHFSAFPINGEINVYTPTLDDRLGVYMIMRLLPRLGIKTDILLTTGEESGHTTARNFVKPEGLNYNWMFSGDRTGEDVVLYRYDTPEMRRRLEKHGFKIGTGSFSCIASLDLGISGFNIGVGYYDYHSIRAYAKMEEFARQVTRFINFYNEFSEEKLAWIKPAYESRGHSIAGRGYGWGHRNHYVNLIDLEEFFFGPYTMAGYWERLSNSPSTKVFKNWRDMPDLTALCVQLGVDYFHGKAYGPVWFGMAVAGNLIVQHKRRSELLGVVVKAFNDGKITDANSKRMAGVLLRLAAEALPATVEIKSLLRFFNSGENPEQWTITTKGAAERGVSELRKVLSVLFDELLPVNVSAKKVRKLINQALIHNSTNALWQFVYEAYQERHQLKKTTVALLTATMAGGHEDIMAHYKPDDPVAGDTSWLVEREADSTPSQVRSSIFRVVIGLDWDDSRELTNELMSLMTEEEFEAVADWLRTRPASSLSKADLNAKIQTILNDTSNDFNANEAADEIVEAIRPYLAGDYNQSVVDGDLYWAIFQKISDLEGNPTYSKSHIDDVIAEIESWPTSRAVTPAEAWLEIEKLFKELK